MKSGDVTVTRNCLRLFALQAHMDSLKKRERKPKK